MQAASIALLAAVCAARDSLSIDNKPAFLSTGRSLLAQPVVVITKALYGVNCPQTNGGADVTSYAQAAVAGQTGSTITWGPIYCA